MRTMFPDLQEGHVYTVTEVSALGLTDDVNYATVRNSYSAEYGSKYFGERDDDIVLEYRVIDAKLLERQVKELRDLLLPHPDHHARIEKVKVLLGQGEMAWPILILKDREPFAFEGCKIREGNHRAVAHYLLGTEKLPVWIMKYSNEPI